ncbi:tyrosine-protein phosphatase [Flavobacterium sp.]|uniref:tyrosine-protein phosphatase n=1 Tax=Flavobacterium sp. TaxID=239 RepID=UPI0038FCBE10
MISFFKSKPTLKDLIPDNYVDIHSHLLPGIDDGSTSFAETLLLTQGMLEIGITQFITTPHIIEHVWDNTKDTIQTLETKTADELNKNNISVPFKAAAEYLMDDQFIRLFKSGQLLTLKDNYVLVEISYTNPPIQLYNIIFDLRIAGFIPVLAHPERYVFYHYNFEEYKKLKKAGCLFQLNLLSLVGYYGIGITKIAEKLLEKGLYDFVGSDIHNYNHIEAFSEKVKVKELATLKEVISNNIFFNQK